jgi:phenylacetate-coenzyme A ligase PaaK-like adenylate-forming protein
MNTIRLRQLVLDAAEHVPFYRRHWKAAGIDLTRIYSAAHLEFLPVVRRADLNACPLEHRIDQRYVHRGYLDPQGDQASVKRRRARFWNALRDVGYVPGEKVLLIAEPAYTLGSALLRWTYVDPKRGDADVFATYARVRPHVLYGPLSSLVSLARCLLVTPEIKCRPKLVISTDGELTDAQNALLQSTFAAPVADFYGTPELGLIAYSRPAATPCSRKSCTSRRCARGTTGASASSSRISAAARCRSSASTRVISFVAISRARASRSCK